MLVGKLLISDAETEKLMSLLPHFGHSAKKPSSAQSQGVNLAILDSVPHFLQLQSLITHPFHSIRYIHCAECRRAAHYYLIIDTLLVGIRVLPH